MKTLNIFRPAFLVVLIVLSAQGMFHILANGEALRSVTVETFAEQRNVLDVIIGPRLMVLYALALISGIGSLILMRREMKSFAFVSLTVALLTVLVDMGLAIKFNIPINNAFKEFPDGSDRWAELQATWVKFILIRGYCLLIGLGTMLTSIFGNQRR